MKAIQTPVEVFFASDERYVPCLSVALASLAENSNPNREYHIHILSTDIGEESRAGLCSVLRENCTLSIIDPSEQIERYREKLNIRLRDYYSESIYYRLFLPRLFPRMKRGVYLDCDIVVLRDIGELFDTDLGGAVVGAVSDESVAVEPVFCRYTKKALGIDGKEYFNSGVLLMDLEAFRREKVAEQIFRTVERYNFETVAPDQDYLNAILRGKTAFLSPIWNKQPLPSRKMAGKHPAIIHYNMFAKPWHYSGVLFEDYFWHYAEMSPWFDRLKTEQSEYSDEKKKKDEKAGKLLLLAAERISAYPGGTFARLMPSAEPKRRVLPTEPVFCLAN